MSQKIEDKADAAEKWQSMNSVAGKAASRELTTPGRKDFMEAGKERLTRDTVRDATRQEINDIKRESADLKHLVADLSLEVYRLKKTAIPLLEEHNGDGA